MESRFKVTFHKPGSYEIVVLIKEKDGDEVVCQTASFTVNVTEEEPGLIKSEEELRSAIAKGGTVELEDGADIVLTSQLTHLQCCHHQGGHQCQDPGRGHHAFLRGQHCDCVGSQGQL